MAEELKKENTSTENNGAEEATENGKFYTEEDLARLLQQEGDKRISQYMKTQEKKQREAEKLKGMNEEDRRVYELDERERKIAEKEEELQMAENKAEGLSILAEKGLSPALIQFVLNADAETMYSNIKTLDKEFKKCVKAEVEKRLGGNAPQANTSTTEGLTKAQFAKMSLAEKQRLFETDRDLYNSLK